MAGETKSKRREQRMQPIFQLKWLTSIDVRFSAFSLDKLCGRFSHTSIDIYRVRSLFIWNSKPQITCVRWTHILTFVRFQIDRQMVWKRCRCAVLCGARCISVLVYNQKTLKITTTAERKTNLQTNQEHRNIKPITLSAIEIAAYQ